MSRRDLQRIANDSKRKWVQLKTHRRILQTLNETDIRAFQATTLVPIDKSRQIVCSLSAQGWAWDHQADIVALNLNRSGAFLKHLNSPGKAMILKQNEDVMLWLEKNIGGKLGPAKKSKTWAWKNGYFPLKHYDARGDLIASSLTAEQRRVQSSHD